MDRFYRSPASRVAAAVLVVLSLASGGYFLLPSGATIAQSPAPAAPPAEALNQANTLSDAFRNSAEKVLPAVVSIRNEVQPKIAKAEPKAPKGARPQLPRASAISSPKVSASWIRSSAVSLMSSPKAAEEGCLKFRMGRA